MQKCKSVEFEGKIAAVFRVTVMLRLKEQASNIF